MKTQNKFIKKVLPLLLIFNFALITCFTVFSQGAAINTTGTPADQSAILDVSSTSTGMLIPRMTKLQRNAINIPAEGLMIYQTDDTVGFWYHSSGWKQIGTAAGGGLAAGTTTGNTLYWNGTAWVESSNIYNAGTSVGIGTNSPEPTALIDLSSNTKGTLITRMTTTERNAITNPAESLQIFNTTTKCFEFFGNNFWNQISCAFVCGNDFVDNRDMQSYQTVQIDTQCWMKENLKYLPNVVGPAIGSSVDPYYYVYGYDGTNVNTAKSQANYTTYGVIYNWAAVTGGNNSSANPSGLQGVCPAGWHLPSDAEWQQLEIFLGMDPSVVNSIGWRGNDEGGKLKETGTLYWASPNTGATNIHGFSAYGGGERDISGAFFNLKNYVSWWSATDFNSNAYRRVLSYGDAFMYRGVASKAYGYSVRCLKD